jgi:hypothetical protein
MSGATAKAATPTEPQAEAGARAVLAAAISERKALLPEADTLRGQLPAAETAVDEKNAIFIAAQDARKNAVGDAAILKAFRHEQEMGSGKTNSATRDFFPAPAPRRGCLRTRVCENARDWRPIACRQGFDGSAGQNFENRAPRASDDILRSSARGRFGRAKMRLRPAWRPSIRQYPESASRASCCRPVRAAPFRSPLSATFSFGSAWLPSTP